MAIGDMAATLVDIQVSEGKYSTVAEETKFDDKPTNNSFQDVAQDLFKNALAKAKQKSKK